MHGPKLITYIHTIVKDVYAASVTIIFNSSSFAANMFTSEHEYDLKDILEKHLSSQVNDIDQMLLLELQLVYECLS